ncbi:Gaa1-like protein [Gorgonomyces haynaldii]|nr:Gaa1-like protein [Gorgonomyces haynaldii]
MLSLLFRFGKYDRDTSRLLAKRRFFNTFRPHLRLVSLVCFVLGVIATCALPLSIGHQSVDADERALLIGQVARYFTHMDDIFAGNRLSWDQQALNNSSSLLFEELSSLGFDTEIQHYQYPVGEDGDLVNDQNVYGILRAPRSEGTEAVILSAPLVDFSGQQNQFGIRVLLNLAAHFRKFSFWSHDIIFLIPGEGLYGMKTWLDAYHGLYCDPMDYRCDNRPIKYRAGPVRAAINIEFTGSQQFGDVGIYPEGVNGKLPNADLVTTVVRALQYEGMNVYFHRNNIRLNSWDPWFLYYDIARQNLLDFLSSQALGLPTAAHSLYMQYKIDGISIVGIPASPGITGIPVDQLARGIESAMRSVNNMLERFHHAFWFYYLPFADRVIPLAIYLAPIMLIIASAVFMSLDLWLRSGSKVIPEAKSREKSFQMLQRPFGDSTFTEMVRPLYIPLLLLATAHTFSFFFLGMKEMIKYTALAGIDQTRFIWTSLVVAHELFSLYFCPLCMRILTGEAGASNSQSVAAWKLLKCLACCECGLFLVVLATSNPSLALILALLLIPQVTLVKPSRDLTGNALQHVLLAFFSPSTIVLGFTFVPGMEVIVRKTIEQVIVGSDLFGGSLMYWLVLFYWPMNMVTQFILSMEI